jgi:hypothetical protein
MPINSLKLQVFDVFPYINVCVYNILHKNVFDFYPANSPKGEKQIKNILKYCLWLPLGNWGKT